LYVVLRTDEHLQRSSVMKESGSEDVQLEGGGFSRRRNASPRMTFFYDVSNLFLRFEATFRLFPRVDGRIEPEHALYSQPVCVLSAVTFSQRVNDNYVYLFCISKPNVPLQRRN